MGTGKNYVAWSATNFNTHKDTECVGILLEVLHVEALPEEVHKFKCWLAVFL